MKELKQLQTKNLLKPRIYSFDEVKALLKEQREEIVEMIEKRIKMWRKGDGNLFPDKVDELKYVLRILEDLKK